MFLGIADRSPYIFFSLSWDWEHTGPTCRILESRVPGTSDELGEMAASGPPRRFESPGGDHEQDCLPRCLGPWFIGWVRARDVSGESTRRAGWRGAGGLGSGH